MYKHSEGRIEVYLLNQEEILVVMLFEDVIASSNSFILKVFYKDYYLIECI